jgi:high affinity choline transporter 7
MAINVGGLVSIIVFYLVILAVGIWAGWRHGKKNQKEATGTESVMLAGRNMGVFVGIMTMTGIHIRLAKPSPRVIKSFFKSLLISNE